MRSTGAAITEIIEAYGNRGGQWVPITEIADTTGLTRAELADAIIELLDTCPTFAAEPQPFGHRITDRDREIAPEVGGEQRHLICFQR